MNFFNKIIIQLLIVIFTVSAIANAQTYKMDRLEAPAINENYGNAVAISGDYALVCAGEGFKVYAYKRNAEGWEQTQVISIPSSNSNDKPLRIAMENEYAVVGRPYYMKNNNGSYIYYYGAIMIFQRSGDTWSLVSTIYPTEPTSGSYGSYFGGDVAMKGDYLIVGGHAYSDYRGCAFVYKRNGSSWNQIKKLTPSDGSTYHYFGENVAISDNYIIIGSRYYNSRGAAFIYKNSNDSWSQTAMITANPSVNSTYFASDLAITDTHAFVGCSKDAVYVFERSNESWSQIDVLKPQQTGEFFGRYLAFDGNKLAIASDSYHTVHSDRSGKITLFKFENNSFTKISTLYPHAAYDAAQGFGSILYFSGNMLIIGAGYHNSWKDFDEAYIVSLSSAFLDIEFDQYTDRAIPFSVYSESGGDLTLLIESSNPTIIPNSNINISNTGTNSMVISTQADTPVNMEMRVTSKANEYGSITMTAILTDSSGHSTEFHFMLHSNNPMIKSEIINPDGNQNHKFGSSIDVDGTTVIVGCTEYTGIFNENLGGVFLYQGSAKDTQIIDSYNDYYVKQGHSVSISGDNAFSSNIDRDKGLYYFRRLNHRWRIHQFEKADTYNMFKDGYPGQSYAESMDMGNRYIIAGYEGYGASGETYDGTAVHLY
jgi:hypothetical protein